MPRTGVPTKGLMRVHLTGTQGPRDSRTRGAFEELVGQLKSDAFNSMRPQAPSLRTPVIVPPLQIHDSTYSVRNTASSGANAVRYYQSRGPSFPSTHRSI